MRLVEAQKLLMRIETVLVLGFIVGCQAVTGTNVSHSTAVVPTTVEHSTVDAFTRPEHSRITVGDGSVSGNGAAIWVAVEKGYFKNYGLDVDVLYTRPVGGIQSVISGELQFVFTGCTEIMQSRRAGSDLTLLANTNPFNLYVIASRPEISDPRQLIGKRVAINQFNDTSHLSARFAIKEAGIDPDTVVYVQVGSTPERFAALQAGAVEGALQAITNVPQIRALGMNVLINLFERRVPYCGSGLAASERFMRDNPRTVEAFLRGFVYGNAYLREGDPEAVKAIMAAYMKTSIDDPQLISAYEYYAKIINPRYQLINRDGVAFIISEQAQADPTWLNWQPEQFYNADIMNKLKEEGFLDAVYDRVR